MNMGAVVYVLCAGAALGCTFLLLRAYLGLRTRLLLWSGICFACLTVSNALVAVDIVLFPGTDFFAARNIAALAGIVALLYGLLWETR